MKLFQTRSRVGAVVAGAAVLAALSGVGGAYAANTIGSEDIRDRSLQNEDLKQGSVTSRGVLDGTMLERDLHPSVQDQLGVPGPKGDDGAQGAQGVQGAQGDQGARGADGVSGYAWAFDVGMATSGSHSYTATCGVGKKVVGGGGRLMPEGAGVVQASYPSDYDAWTVVLDAQAPANFEVTAICASVAGSSIS